MEGAEPFDSTFDFPVQPFNKPIPANSAANYVPLFLLFEIPTDFFLDCINILKQTIRNNLLGPHLCYMHCRAKKQACIFNCSFPAYAPGKNAQFVVNYPKPVSFPLNFYVSFISMPCCWYANFSSRNYFFKLPTPIALLPHKLP